jgi:hypothetical protein
MAAHLGLETARAFKYGHFLRAQKNMMAALSLHPWGSLRVATSSSTFRFMLSKAKGGSYRAGTGADFTRGQTGEGKQ